MPTLLPDGSWFAYQHDPAFVAALDGTARTWIHLVKMWSVEPHGAGLQLAYDRAVLALAQLPIEYAGPATRYERSRWRAVTVDPAQDAKCHCEHPWTKKRTKAIVREAVSAALRRDVRHEDMVAAVGGILAARQDTVLLPHNRVTELGVRSERHHDGLAPRYGDAVQHGTLTLVDRLTGACLTTNDLLQIEDAASARVTAAVECLAGARDAWSPVLRDAMFNPH